MLCVNRGNFSTCKQLQRKIAFMVQTTIISHNKGNQMMLGIFIVKNMYRSHQIRMISSISNSWKPIQKRIWWGYLITDINKYQATLAIVYCMTCYEISHTNASLSHDHINLQFIFTNPTRLIFTLVIFVVLAKILLPIH